MLRAPTTALGAILLLSTTLTHASQLQPVAEILITAFHDKQWQVRYELPQPATELVFARSPDDSRRQTWLADVFFEIVSTPRGEILRRKDGAPFENVRIRMDAKYRHLPNDYAPFSPFGDGGMLFHSGRLFACPNACTSGAAWSFSLWADPDDSIAIDGRRESYFSQWTDSGDGRMVYVGRNKGRRTPQFMAIVDETMPASVRGPLLSDLPATIRDFADRFGRLDGPLTLFASYDEKHQPGWGRQGGTLPGQIFTHFYGGEWQSRMKQPGFAFDLAWHFAHEAAHLYQHQRPSSGAGDSWIHEGAAEAFAALELRSRNQAASNAVRDKIAQARTKCAQDLGDRPMNEVLLGSDLSAAYSCGLLLNVYVDAQVRRRNPDGLFAVWREYLRRTSANGAGDRGAYLDAIASTGGADLASSVKALLDAKHPNIDTAG